MCHCGATVCATVVPLCVPLICVPACVPVCLPACLPACYYYAIIITRLPACLLLLCYYYYAVIITTLCCVCRCGATVCATDLPACLRVCLPACLPALLPDLCSHAGLGFHKGQHVAGCVSRYMCSTDLHSGLWLLLHSTNIAGINIHVADWAAHQAWLSGHMGVFQGEGSRANVWV